MRRVSDLPSDRFPRGPAPPPLGLPAPRPRPSGHRAGPLARSVHGRPGAQRGRAWVGRSARPGARGRRGRGCVPARVRGRGRGVCHVCRGRGWPRDPGPPESGGRTAEGHAREPRPAPLYSHASRSCSWSPPAARPYCLSSASVINTTFLQSLSVPTVYPRRLCPLSHLKKKKSF